MGTLNSMRYISPLKLEATKGLETLIEELENLGYTADYNLKGAPRDWRLAPNELDDHFKKVKVLADSLCQRFRRPVIFVGHSSGAIAAYFFLRQQTSKWKTKCARAFVSIGGPIGGTFRTIRHGLGLNIESGSIFESILKAELTFSITAFLAPYSAIWKNAILIQTKSKNYTAFDMEKIASVISKNSYKMYKNVKDLNGNLEHPGTDVYFIAGTGIKTPRGLIYEDDEFRSKPKTIWGNGDGTVNEECFPAYFKWSTVSSYKFYFETMTKTHLGLVRENDSAKRIAHLIATI
ncbi:hypothetical protein B4U79_17368 [Dinothrombium tinctorium]|uniref:Group XV phospholipase A2-like protein n=1 Tax=Dinothrombium tinctorium TaxID=1965070 RepID=A0A3S3Q3M4_9ACAR|nr:hypothetical protein B4U79_16528 [Dinothrombium tinctorium]RWS13331.1 hypothetical protein B4U79_17368 [Dinothrombium tinctorium]